MKSALLISLGFHIAVGLISMSLVRFAHVRFVPRDVYFVDLVTPLPAQPQVKQPRPAPVVVEPTPPKPDIKEPEPEPKPDEFVPPPEEKKEKPKPKPVEKKKTVPSTTVRKTEIDTTLTQPTPDEPVATGDIFLDGQEFPFAYYLTTMKRKIASLWQVPAQASGDEKYCTIYFRVGRDGDIRSPMVEKSSGSFLFDQAALRAVVQANPLPPLPAGFADDYLGVHFSFAYEETISP